jgi:branched-chain amino acid transport system permease protein
MTRSRTVPALATAAAALAAALVPLLLDPQGYWIRVFALTFIFAALAQSWNIVGGLVNQISLGHAAFFGIGAYTSTLLLINYAVSPWIGLVGGAVLGGLAAAFIAFPTMRLKGHYFALATLAFGEVMRIIANSWSSLTGGPVGLSVPLLPESFLMYSFRSTVPHYYIALAALIIVTAVFLAVQSRPLGYRLRAVKDNEDAAEVIGVDTTYVKLQSAVISGTLTAALGTVYAQLALFFDPDSAFGVVSISIRMALIAIIGGVGSAIGPLLGAIFIMPLEEILNEVLSDRAAGLAQLVYGVLLIAVILWRPGGLVTLLHLYGKRRERAG